MINIKLTYTIYHYRDECELFDLDKDPLESKNVIDDPSYQDIAKELKDKLRQWQVNINDPWLCIPRGKRKDKTFSQSWDCTINESYTVHISNVKKLREVSFLSFSRFRRYLQLPPMPKTLELAIFVASTTMMTTTTTDHFQGQGPSIQIYKGHDIHRVSFRGGRHLPPLEIFAAN